MDTKDNIVAKKEHEPAVREFNLIFTDITIDNLEKEMKKLLEQGGGKKRGFFRDVSKLDWKEMNQEEVDRFYKMVGDFKKYTNQRPDVSKFKMKINDAFYSMDLVYNYKYEEPLSFEIQRENDRFELKSIKEKFEEFEEQGVTYIASPKHISDDHRAKYLINEEFIPSQSKWQIRNGAQYKLVKPEEINKKAESTSKVDKEELINFNFDTSLIKMFYENFEEDNLKSFLMESHKISVNENMAFIPIKINNKNNYHYILFIDNKVEDLSLFRIKNLRYINDQSNLFNLLQNILPDRISNKQKQYKNFLKSFVNELSKNILFNENLLNRLYPNLNDFYKDKRILKQFKYLNY